jgi:hypothetical protein
MIIEQENFAVEYDLTDDQLNELGKKCCTLDPSTLLDVNINFIFFQIIKVCIKQNPNVIIIPDYNKQYLQINYQLIRKDKNLFNLIYKL